MRWLLCALLAVAALASLPVHAQSGCDSPYVTPTSLEFGADGGQAIFTVTANSGCSYSISSSSGDWLSASPASIAAQGSAHTVTVVAGPWTGYEPRYGAIYVVPSGGYGIVVSVTQEISCAEIRLTPGSLSFDADGGTAGLFILTDGGCTYTVASGDPWLSISPSGSLTGRQTVTVTAQRNTLGLDRQGSIDIVGAGDGALVYQSGTSASHGDGSSHGGEHGGLEDWDVPGPSPVAFLLLLVAVVAILRRDRNA